MSIGEGTRESLLECGRSSWGLHSLVGQCFMAPRLTRSPSAGGPCTAGGGRAQLRSLACREVDFRQLVRRNYQRRPPALRIAGQRSLREKAQLKRLRRICSSNEKCAVGPRWRHDDCQQMSVVKKGPQKNATNPIQFGVEAVDLMEEMLFQRAASGVRPVLYLSSYTDLECSMLMLLDDTGEARWSAEQAPAAKQPGYHIITN